MKKEQIFQAFAKLQCEHANVMGYLLHICSFQELQTSPTCRLADVVAVWLYVSALSDTLEITMAHQTSF